MKYDLAKSWDEIVDSGLGLTSAGNAELECCGRCCLQIPDQYIYKIDDHNTWVNRVKSIKKYRNMLRKKYKVQQSAITIISLDPAGLRGVMLKKLLYNIARIFASVLH